MLKGSFWIRSIVLISVESLVCKTTNYPKLKSVTQEREKFFPKKFFSKGRINNYARCVIGVPLVFVQWENLNSISDS